MGGVINSDMVFDTHPVGPLDPDHYSSLGVTLGVTGGFNGIVFGAGPGEGNTGTPPRPRGRVIIRHRTPVRQRGPGDLHGLLRLPHDRGGASAKRQSPVSSGMAAPR